MDRKEADKKVIEFDRRVHIALQQDPALRPYGSLNPQELKSTIAYAFREGH